MSQLSELFVLAFVWTLVGLLLAFVLAIEAAIWIKKRSRAIVKKNQELPGTCSFVCLRSGEMISLYWRNARGGFLWRFKPDDLLSAVSYVGLQVADPELPLSQVEADKIKVKMRRMADPKWFRSMIAQALQKGLMVSASTATFSGSGSVDCN